MLNYDDTERNLKTSVRDGVFSSIFTGFTKSYIAPLAIALKASNSMVALFSSVPELFANIFQLLTITAARRFRSRKWLLVASTAMQAFIWIPIMLVPFLSPQNLWLLLLLVTLSTTVGQFMQPIWNSYMGDLVPVNERGKFFGGRNVVVGVFTFASTLAAGLVLQHSSGATAYIGFSIIFTIAILARFMSTYFKSRMIDLPLSQKKTEEFSLWEFLARMNKTNYGVFVIFVSLMKFSVYVSAPFFTIYMLKELGFSYWQFTAVTSISLIMSFIFMAIWGRLIDRRGSRFVLYVTGMLVVFIPVIWVAAASGLSGMMLFVAILAAEAFSGLAWAGFDLSASNFIFDAVRPEKRIRCIAYYNLLIGIGIFAGTALGSLVVDKLHGLFSISSILLVFLVSSILRLIVVLVFLPRLKEVRLIEIPLGHTLFHRILDVRPRSGFDVVIIDKGPALIERPVTPSPTQAKASPQKQFHGRATVDILKRNVDREMHRHDRPIRQSIKDQRTLQNIMDEMKRGKYPDEFKRK
jgi:MFS family permease